MIVVYMMGNLGNQMFIYAMARSLQLKNKDPELLVDLSGLKRFYYTADYKLDKFSIPSGILYDMSKLKTLQRVKYRLTTSLFHLQHFYYRHTREDLIIPPKVIMWWLKRGCYYSTNRPLETFPEVGKKFKNSFVYGYFQSSQYFEDYEETIRKELRVKLPVSQADMQLIEEMRNCNSVAVSIRANKTPENPKVKDNVELGFIAKEYYYAGMKKIAERINNPVFYIFADDLDIVKKEYNFEYPVVYVLPEDSATGMRLLYNCKHFVIANSTFSWWGAYLGDDPSKTVIMPTPWDRHGPLRECIYMKNAITIPCEFED